MGIEISKDWCCEKCGMLIKGICFNDNGYVTHIRPCINYKESY